MRVNVQTVFVFPPRVLCDTGYCCSFAVSELSHSDDVCSGLKKC